MEKDLGEICNTKWLADAWNINFLHCNTFNSLFVGLLDGARIANDQEESK